jgi:heat shock protein HslJ
MQLSFSLLTAALAAGCARPGPPPAPTLGTNLDPARMAALVTGVWKLEQIDGLPAKGWLAFGPKSNQISFTAGCNAAWGTYTIDGDTIIVDAPYSTLSNCTEPRLPTAPSFLWRTLRFEVDRRTLVMTAATPVTPANPNRWARYSRSSTAEFHAESLRKRHRHR